MDSKSVTNNVGGGGMKKGPWTAAEDAILVEYVRKHGEGNWNAVQKNSGLMRCGKSCRLRWANHLRPNLKKGSFTPSEERIILDLHAKLGNKWARMATQLPGRTDNEIKNFWNTRMKRRQRAGLPLYPQTFRGIDSTTNHPQQKTPNSSPFSSFVSSRKPAFNHRLPFLDSITFSPAFDPLQNNFQNSSFYSNPTLQFKPFPEENTTHLSPLPLSPAPHQYVTTTPPQPSPLSSFCYNNGGFDSNMSFTSLIMEDGQTSGGVIAGLDPELPSSQTPQFVARNETQEPLIHEESRSSGLLDTLLMESENLVRKEKMNGEDVLDKGKRKMEDEEEEEESRKRVKLGSTNSGVASATIHSCEDITSSHSSIGTKASEEAMEEMNSMDDDLLSLLDNFPTAAPLPDWYRASEGMSSDIVQPVEAQQIDSPARAESPIVEWGLGSSPSFWNNMPSIC